MIIFKLCFMFDWFDPHRESLFLKYITFTSIMKKNTAYKTYFKYLCWISIMTWRPIGFVIYIVVSRLTGTVMKEILILPCHVHRTG